MHWFEPFVDETVRQYRHSVNEKKASVLEDVEEYLSKEHVWRSFGGLVGEIS